MKKIITILCELFCIANVFAQYTVLPKSGDPIEVLGIEKCQDESVIFVDMAKNTIEMKMSDVLLVLSPSGEEMECKDIPVYGSKKQSAAPNKSAAQTVTATSSDKNQVLRGQEKSPASKGNDEKRADILVFRDASTLKVHILSTNSTEVVYRLANQQSSEVFVEALQNIATIVYSNGEVEKIMTQHSQDAASKECSKVCANGIVVMCEDLPAKYEWTQANKACPPGWRLPTVTEFQSICTSHSQEYTNRRDNINLNAEEYWTSSVNRRYRPLSVTTNDCEGEARDSDEKYSVRCVKE